MRRSDRFKTTAPNGLLVVFEAPRCHTRKRVSDFGASAAVALDCPLSANRRLVSELRRLNGEAGLNIRTPSDGGRPRPAGREHERADQNHPGRGSHSSRLVQHRRRSAVAAAAGAASRHRPAGRAGRPRAALPDGAHRAGGRAERRDRDSRAGARHLSQWRPTPLYRARRLEKALGTRRAHLLQIRRREPRRQPQAEHRRRPGVLQQGGGRSASCRPRPAPGNGARRSPSPARCSASKSTSTW